ncbi:hypothetical protein [Salibacterium halotolerans]|uniref:Uncharacterized protein n=1 Tax=Salibacterium halotolerans TaxID=1884432 RepID=A0A1I5SAE4_9BACI|nr:hypothetical protein [Salibacterium halotolerans]SFP67681.1 hypothetical protein SAMN05518683_108111 [Salibacterium halotolerans]
MADEQQNENQEFDKLDDEEEQNERRDEEEENEELDEESEESEEDEDDEEEEKKSSEPDVGKSLFTIGQQVSYKNKACTVINEYERSLCIEYNHFPFLEENEEDFPYRREIIRKGEAEAPVE